MTLPTTDASELPLPLAGEGWGGGSPLAAASRRLRGFQQAAPAQQGVGFRRPAAEGDVGILGVAGAARRIDVVMQPPGDGGIEDVAGFLEGTEGVGVHHFRPHVAVVARRVVIAGEDVTEL